MVSFLPKLTWDDIINDDKYQTFEDPISGTLWKKDIFYNQYRKICDQLNGNSMTDYVDIFFELSPINGSMTFIDDDSQNDFIDWAVDENIIDSFFEIKQGETYKHKLQREKQERELLNKEAQKIQKQKKKKLGIEEILIKKIENIQNIINSGKLEGYKLEKTNIKLYEAQAELKSLKIHTVYND